MRFRQSQGIMQVNMTEYILAIDQGTTGTTALLVGHDLRIHGRQTVDFQQHFPKPGWVEHNPEEIWASVRKAILYLLEKTGVGNGRPPNTAQVTQERQHKQQQHPGPFRTANIEEFIKYLGAFL